MNGGKEMRTTREGRVGDQQDERTLVLILLPNSHEPPQFAMRLKTYIMVMDLSPETPILR